MGGQISCETIRSRPIMAHIYSMIPARPIKTSAGKIPPFQLREGMQSA